MNMNGQIASKVIVHPGVFHADDVCAVAWLLIAGHDFPVERRNPTDIELADPTVMVVDVGGQYDPELLNFDHHQKGGAGCRWDTDVPYAAFGLVYDYLQPKDPAVAQRLHDRVVLAVDAADCGWGTQTGTRPTFSFSAVIAGFNPGPGASVDERIVAFKQAVLVARAVLENELQAAVAFVDAKKAVMAAHTADAGRVLILEEFAPWDEHIFERPDVNGLLYVVFPSVRGGWCVQQVPQAPGSFKGRKPLPGTWAGLRGEEFAKLAGLSTHGPATFCHQGRFICGAQTREDALILAARAIEAGDTAV